MKGLKVITAIRHLHRSQGGLTAIELAVVVAILAVLAGLVATSTTGMNTSARGTAQITDISEVQKAVDNYVGQNPNSEYPVSGAKVLCSSGGASSGTLTDLTKVGLATLGSSDCVALKVDASFTTPDTTPVTKTFVPDFMQRNPKHVSETPNTWLIGKDGNVTNVLPADRY